MKRISQEEEEKQRLEDEIDRLTKSLTKVDESLRKRRAKKKCYDKTIEQTEAAYKKILESSQTLLHVLKKETHNLDNEEAGNDYDCDYD